MFFRRMKQKAWNEGYRKGYRQSARDSVIMSGDPDSSEQLNYLEAQWALTDARREGRDI